MNAASELQLSFEAKNMLLLLCELQLSLEAKNMLLLLCEIELFSYGGGCVM
jgi:hypothetical protein